jgi:hypothetical protein
VEGLPAELVRPVRPWLGVGGWYWENEFHRHLLLVVLFYILVMNICFVMMGLQRNGCFIGLTCPEQKRVCTEENPCSDMGIMAMKFPEPAAVIACEEYWTGSTPMGRWVLQDE